MPITKCTGIAMAIGNYCRSGKALALACTGTIERSVLVFAFQEMSSLCYCSCDEERACRFQKNVEFSLYEMQ